MIVETQQQHCTILMIVLSIPNTIWKANSKISISLYTNINFQIGPFVCIIYVKYEVASYFILSFYIQVLLIFVHNYQIITVLILGA
jgi:hypothetical protein